MDEMDVSKTAYMKSHTPSPVYAARLLIGLSALVHVILRCRC